MYRLANRPGQWSGIADAGGTAVADHAETNTLEVFKQPGIAQVVGDDLRTRCQRGLDPGFNGKTFSHGVSRQQAGSDDDAGIGGVGATGDSRNHYGKVS